MTYFMSSSFHLKSLTGMLEYMEKAIFRDLPNWFTVMRCLLD